MSNPKIMLVTTDRKFARIARDTLCPTFDLSIVSSGEKALQVFDRDHRYMVVISSMKLKGMDGREFLAAAMQEQPKITRIMVTAFPEFDHAVQLVNTADISWLLTQPCAAEDLLKAVTDSVARYKREQTEAEAMRDTLTGSVRMLVDIMELTHPEAMRRSKRIRRRAQQISRFLKAMPPHLMDMIVLLSNIGCVGLPKGLLKKMETGKDITKADMKRFRTHPSIAARLLENVPRMGRMAGIIRHQHTPCSQTPPLGARILKVCIDMDQMQRNGSSPDKALEFMRAKPEIYDAAVVDALARHLQENEKLECSTLWVADLEPGMVMQADMVTERGTILLHRGETLSEASHIRIQAFNDLLKIKEPVCIVPQDSTCKL